jgi:hypothetical protein
MVEMSKCFLREPFRVVACLGSLSPRLAIRTQGDAFDAESLATLFEFRGAVARAKRSKMSINLGVDRFLRCEGRTKLQP